MKHPVRVLDEEVPLTRRAGITATGSTAKGKIRQSEQYYLGADYFPVKTTLHQGGKTMIKQTIVALILSVRASSVFAAGTVKVFSNGSSEAKTLTGAEYFSLVGQPRLANSWWPGAVISEELAAAAALRQQRALLTRLAGTCCRFQRRRCRRD